MPDFSELLHSAAVEPLTRRIPDPPNDYVYVNFSHGETRPQANVLYICTDGIPEGALQFASCGLILMPDHGLSEEQLQGADCEYCVIPPTDPLFLIRSIQDRLIQRRCDDRLTQLRSRIMVHRLSLGAVVHNLCEIIGNPVAVYDSSYNLLAMESMGMPVQNRVWNIAKTQGSFPPEIVEEFCMVIGERDISHHPFLCTTHSWKDSHCMVMQLISKYGALLGSIAIYESFRPFAADDVDIVIHAAEILSELLETNATGSDINQSRVLLFRELLEGKSFSAAELSHQRKASGWDSAGFLRVGYVHLLDDQTKQRQCEYFCRILSKISDQIVAVSRNKNVVFLICGEDLQEIQNLIDAVQAALSKFDFSFGLSNCFYDIQDARKMYKKAQEACLIGARILGKKPFYLAEDILFYSMIQNFSPRKLRELYQSTSFYRIDCFDRQHETNYCDTLIEYFSNTLRSSQTAEKLFIHKNSLLYRLGRVGALFGFDLDSFHDIFDFWLGYKLNLYLCYAENDTEQLRASE